MALDAVDAGIDAGDGADSVSLFGGLIDGLNGGNTIEMGTGADTLVVNDLADAGQFLDISGIVVFNGGTGADTANFFNLNSGQVAGALLDRQFNSWDVVNFTNSERGPAMLGPQLRTHIS